MLCEEEYSDIISQAGDANQGEAMLDGFVRKITSERRTAVYEKTMTELERRKHFENMVSGTSPVSSPVSNPVSTANLASNGPLIAYPSYILVLNPPTKLLSCIHVKVVVCVVCLHR